MSDLALCKVITLFESWDGGRRLVKQVFPHRSPPQQRSWPLDCSRVCVLANFHKLGELEGTYMTGKCESLSRVRLFGTPWTVPPPGSSVHGILQARILEWVAIPLLQGIFPAQRSDPGLLHCRRSPAWLGRTSYITWLRCCPTLLFSSISLHWSLRKWSFLSLLTVLY